MPKISVIIPIYNAEKHLKQCLDSVLNQTISDIEILCIEDFSKDNSKKILEEYRNKDNRLKFLNGFGQTAGNVRNIGLKCAVGKYIYFLDADDYIDTTTLEKVYNKIKSSDADICIFKNNRYRELKKEYESCHWERLVKNIPQKDVFNVDDVANHIFQVSNIAVWTKMYRRDFITDNNIVFQNIKTCNDVYFNFMTLVCAQKITFLNEELITHRIEHSECLTKNRGKQVENILIAFRFLKKELKKRKLFAKVQNSFYRKARSCFRHELEFVDNKIIHCFLWLKLFSYLPLKYYYKDILQFFFALRNKGNYKYLTLLNIDIKIKPVAPGR